LSELEMVCDRVAILVKGKVYSQGTIAELTEHRKFYEIEVESSGADASREMYSRALSNVVKPGAAAPETATMALAQMPGKQIATLGTGELVVVDQGVLRVATVRAETVQPIIDALRAHGAVIKTVRSVKPSLEDLFMEAVIDPTTGEALTPGAAENVNRGDKGQVNGGVKS
jgi:ABC-type multidrug transport system ATPase subunit